MEIKKSPKADLQNKKGLFLEIGLIVALLAVIAAFLYTPKEYRIEKVDNNYGPVEEEITEITRNEQKPPEQPQKVEVKVFNDILDIVTNDAKITTDISFEDFADDLEITTQVVEVEEEEIEDDQPFIKVEKMPSFQGGDLNKFRNWVQERVRYPQIAQENGVSGKVVLSFVIEKDGTLTNIEVLQSPDRSLADEAVRVLKTSPKWEPGQQRNQPVRVKYTLPVDFRIQN
ncbi:energy transducer TonB [Alistipes sp. Z76]|nr:energy transducer TonB [Alistipes sp. Z76]NCE67975.1 energy transducer TonB [Muribaculaceae bacterium M3]